MKGHVRSTQLPTVPFQQDSLAPWMRQAPAPEAPICCLDGRAKHAGLGKGLLSWRLHGKAVGLCCYCRCACCLVGWAGGGCAVQGGRVGRAAGEQRQQCHTGAGQAGAQQRQQLAHPATRAVA